MESNKQLIQDLKRIIETSRNTIYRQVNNELLLMNFKIGERLSKIVNPKDGRPALDAKTITTISRALTQEYGKGFSRQNLSLMIIFFKDYKNCQSYKHFSKRESKFLFHSSDTRY